MAKQKPLTAEELGQIPREEFDSGRWGSIDPWYFKDPPKKDEDSDYAGLYEVLERVVKRLNER